MGPLRAIRRFVFDEDEPSEISVVKVPTDTNKWEDIKRKIEAAKADLGPKYLLASENRVGRRSQ